MRSAYGSSAAEMRAAAAEARLARSAESALQQMDDGDDESDLKPDAKAEDDDSDADVPDPHLDSDARRKELEAETNGEERQELEGGWEEFVSCNIPGVDELDGDGEIGPGIKRERSASPPRAKKAFKQEPKSETQPNRVVRTFGKGMVHKEQERALALLGTGKGKAVEPTERDGWDCKLCTFHNVSGRNQCGQCSQRSAQH